MTTSNPHPPEAQNTGDKMQNYSHEWDETYAMALCKKCGAIKTADHNQQRGCHSIAVSEAQNLADSRGAFHQWLETIDPIMFGAVQVAWMAWQARDPEIEALKVHLTALKANHLQDLIKLNDIIEALRAQVMPEREVAAEIMAREFQQHRHRFVGGVRFIDPLSCDKEAANAAYDALLAHMRRHAGEGK